MAAAHRVFRAASIPSVTWLDAYLLHTRGSRFKWLTPALPDSTTCYWPILLSFLLQTQRLIVIIPTNFLWSTSSSPRRLCHRNTRTGKRHNIVSASCCLRLLIVMVVGWLVGASECVPRWRSVGRPFLPFSNPGQPAHFLTPRLLFCCPPRSIVSPSTEVTFVYLHDYSHTTDLGRNISCLHC